MNMNFFKEELNHSENKENPLVNTETVTGNELVDVIYQGDSLPHDERFLPSEKGGVFKYFDIRSLVENKKDLFYSIIKEASKVIGLSELEKIPNQEKQYWIKFVSIDPKYQGKGLASKLVEEIFRFARQEGATLESSSYSSDGYDKLKPLFNKFAEEFSVNFIDVERKLPDSLK